MYVHGGTFYFLHHIDTCQRVYCTSTNVPVKRITKTALAVRATEKELINVSGFEKRDQFALCIKCHYGRKHANESCFQ